MPPSEYTVESRESRLFPGSPARCHLRLVQIEPALGDVLGARGHVLRRLSPLLLQLERLPLQLVDRRILTHSGRRIAGQAALLPPECELQLHREGLLPDGRELLGRLRLVQLR